MPIVLLCLAALLCLPCALGAIITLGQNAAAPTHRALRPIATPPRR